MISRGVAVKSISLTFRGFDVSCQEVQSIIGVAASSFGQKGDPVRPGISTLLKRSYVQYSVELPRGCRLDEMFPKLMAQLGGVRHLCTVRDQVRPEFFELDLVLPVKGSDEQEAGFLSPEIITEISILKASLSFQFL